MAQEAPTNFKALMAKFQEEANLAQARNNRPIVAEKPRFLPLSGGHCSSVVSCTQAAAENKTPVVPRIIFRDGLRASGGKCSISFPTQPQKRSPPTLLTGGDNTTTKQSLRDRNMPLVLPVAPIKEHKALATKEQQPEQEPLKEVLSSSKIKKKGLLLPFKSTRVSKTNLGIGEEPTSTDLTIRPASAPGELSSVERQRLGEEVSVQGDQSATECHLSSPEISITPPLAGTNGDTNNRIMSTLERAKRKFSCRQLLAYNKHKNLRSPEVNSKDKLSPLPPGSTEPELLVALPALACVSARPFVKVNTSAHKSGLDKQLGKDIVAGLTSVRPDECHLPVAPHKKPLPNLKSLGPSPVKPPRPPHVDLSCYHPTQAQKMSEPNHTSREEQESDQRSITSSVLEAPEFPDFENPEIETAECPAIDIATLELEDLELVNFELLPIDDFGVLNLETLKSDLPVCEATEPGCFDQQALSFDSNDLIPLDPEAFPDPPDFSEILEPLYPRFWPQNNEVVSAPIVEPQTEEVDLGPAETHSVTEETDPGSHAALNNVIQPQLSTFQCDSYHKACDNVYEDVENINKLIANQISRKIKGSLKNPYATSSNSRAREEARLNIWPRNPWGPVSGEHGHLIHAHFHSKEWQSPDNIDCKEQRKKEKHRREKEKKEQKGREKKENEMKKKYKVTGEEEPMYHAKVMLACKVRKNDLPVKTGDTVGIIRTTNCPKGKWLARDANQKYGYISVMNVELNIKEMLVLGKKVQAAGKGGNAEGDTVSIGSRSSNLPMNSSSFTDDSEEWACEDETYSFSTDTNSFQQQTVSMPENLCSNTSAPHMLCDANMEEAHAQPSHEALQKLATFFQHNTNDITDSERATLTNAEPPSGLCAVEEPPYPDQEVEFTDMVLLPPPPLYADSF